MSTGPGADTRGWSATFVHPSAGGAVLERASEAAPRPELDWTRDWQGRPRILPDPQWSAEAGERWAEGRANDQGEVPYTRVTTYAEALQDASALSRWKMRRVLLGASRRPDYVTAAAALTTEDRDRDALDDLAEKALEAAGPNAADIGTALHGFTERIDRGEYVGDIPAEHVAGLEAYSRVTAHLRFVEFECRTVCDALEVAGTPDRVGFCDVPDPDGVVDELRIIDTKTGRVDYSAGKFSTQLAIYAHSDLYHPGTGERTTWQSRHGVPVNLRWGLIVHVPAGSGMAELLWIRLEHGWAGAQEAGKVREWRSEASARNLLRPVFARAPRPATTDGSCRGRLESGKPCTYRAKKVDGQATQWCGRHQAQQDGLERWLAENPGTDPDTGVEERPAMEPVQPATGAAVETTVFGLPAATPEQLAAQAVAEQDAADDAQDRADRALAVAVDENLEDLTEPVEVRCTRTGLLINQCACPAHRGGQTPEEEAAQPPPVRELGTYALDPATEVNGNPRAVSRLQTPEDAATARFETFAGIMRQIDVARSESELQLIYQQHAANWSPVLTAAAGERSRQIAEQRAAEKPEAALLAAVLTAPGTPVLMQLHTQYSGGRLWTAEVDAAASARWRQLEAASQLEG